MIQTPDPEKRALNRERNKLLVLIERWLETPMVVLGFVWLALLVIEFIWGLNRLLEVLGTVIWIVFILDFALRFTLAPHKKRYLRKNWITVIALLLPALRVFRIVRALRVLRLARATRGIRLVRVLSSINRGMRALGKVMGRRGFGYVVVLTIIVTLAGAAGMYAFESDNPSGPHLANYGTALWWTAMLMTTLGSEYWPQSTEGRVLCFLLALYAFTIFGYLTATLATFFVDREASNEDSELVGQGTIESLHAEIASLRIEIREMAQGYRLNQAQALDQVQAIEKISPTSDEDDNLGHEKYSSSIQRPSR